MAPNVKSAKQKPAGGQKAQAGPSNKMQKFSGSAPQKADSTAQQSAVRGKGAPFAKGGPSGKMTGNMTVKAQKPGTSAQSNTIGRSSYAK